MGRTETVSPGRRFRPARATSDIYVVPPTCHFCGNRRSCTLVADRAGRSSRTYWACEDCRRRFGMESVGAAHRGDAEPVVPRRSMSCSMCKAIGPCDLVTMPPPYGHIRSYVCASCAQGLNVARLRGGADVPADHDGSAEASTSVGRRVWTYLNQPVRLPGGGTASPSSRVPDSGGDGESAPDTAEAARRLWAYLNQPVRIPLRRTQPERVLDADGLVR